MPKLARNDLIPHFAQSIARTPTRYAVEGVRGLFLYVSVRGKCTWFLRYQKGRGEKRRRRYRRIGDAAVMGLAEAVDRARNLIASLTAGRGTKSFERDPLRAATMTVAELVAEFPFKARYDYMKRRAILNLKTFANQSQRPVDLAIHLAIAELSL
jgi:Arm DNA-binding domain